MVSPLNFNHFIIYFLTDSYKNEDKVSIGNLNPWKFNEVEVHRNNLHFPQNEKPPTKKDEGGLKVAEKLNLRRITVWLRFVLTT